MDVAPYHHPRDRAGCEVIAWYPCGCCDCGTGECKRYPTAASNYVPPPEKFELDDKPGRKVYPPHWPPLELELAAPWAPEPCWALVPALRETRKDYVRHRGQRLRAGRPGGSSAGGTDGR